MKSTHPLSERILMGVIIAILAVPLPLTIDNLSELAGSMWRAIGNRAFAAALGELGSLERELGRLTEAER